MHLDSTPSAATILRQRSGIDASKSQASAPNTPVPTPVDPLGSMMAGVSSLFRSPAVTPTATTAAISAKQAPRTHLSITIPDHNAAASPLKPNSGTPILTPTDPRLARKSDTVGTPVKSPSLVSRQPSASSDLVATGTTPSATDSARARSPPRATTTSALPPLTPTTFTPKTQPASTGYSQASREQQKSVEQKLKTDQRQLGPRHGAEQKPQAVAPIAGTSEKKPVKPANDTNELANLFKKQASESKPLLSVKVLPKIQKKPPTVSVEKEKSKSTSDDHAKAHDRRKERDGKSREKSLESMSKDERRAWKQKKKEKEAKRLHEKQREERRLAAEAKAKKEEARKKKQANESDESGGSSDSESDEEKRAQKTLAKEFEEIMAGLEDEPVSRLQVCAHARQLAFSSNKYSFT